MMDPVFFNASTPAASTPHGGQARLAEAAREFEAIFLRQMLSAARQADFGGEDLFGSEGTETFRELRDARFAELAAKSGTLGIAAFVEARLTPFLAREG